LKFSTLSGSALVATALLTSSLILSATTSSAETLSSQGQQQKSIAEAANPVTLDISSKGNLGEKIAAEESYVVPPRPYVATAYSLRGRTASGRMVSKGLIAADPKHLTVLSLGSKKR